MYILRFFKMVCFIVCITCSFYSIPGLADNLCVPSVSDTIKITADFNDGVWNNAATFTEFATSKGDVSSANTKLYLMHNKNNLYVGFECFDQDPNKLVVDSRYLPNGDSVAFALDSFNDGLASYVFLCNPNGDKLVGVLSNSENTSRLCFSFITEYTTISKRTLNGYNVVIIVPFKNIPYAWQPKILMSFRAVRLISEDKEEDNYPHIVGNQQDGLLPQYQTIQLENIVKSEYQKPWFDINVIYANRKRFAEGFDFNTVRGRALGWGQNDSSVADYKMLPCHILTPSKNPKPLQENLQTKWVEQQFRNIEFYPDHKINDLDHFLMRTQTTSFIIVHDDKIIYEKYFNGADRSFMAPAFSMTKSFISALIGIAIDKKQINSVGDPITNYLPELLARDKRFARITIKDLLSMSTGIRAIQDAPYYDETVAYWTPELKNVLLNTLVIIEPPGRHFHYHDYFAQLAGLVLMRATNQSVTQLLQNEILEPLGAEYGGSWSIDSKKDDLEQLAIGINVPARDYAKFGLLFLHEGKWDNKQIISSAWVNESTQPVPKPLGYYPKEMSQESYKYFWRSLKRTNEKNDKNDFLAAGHKGQLIYISPQKNLIIVRTGMDFGIEYSLWKSILYDFVSKF